MHLTMKEMFVFVTNYDSQIFDVLVIETSPYHPILNLLLAPWQFQIIGLKQIVVVGLVVKFCPALMNLWT